MPVCYLCGEEYGEEETDVCNDCGETFCKQHGNINLHLCNNCLQEDYDTDEDQAETDQDEGIEKEMKQ